MDSQNFDALVNFRFAPAFWHWRRIDIKPFDFNKTDRLKPISKFYRGVTRGSIGNRNMFVSISRLRISPKPNFTFCRLAEVQVINQFEHFSLVTFEDENIVEIRHKPAASLFAY